jgi:glycosyltransferase involved in cell wall biosynthesis
MPEPLVSVVIPSYNCAAYLGAAIGSALSQSYRPIEILVVDDGSTDGTSSVVESFGEGVRYLRQEHAGVGAARNLGIRHAKGEFFALLDADDLWTEGKTELQMKLLSEHPEIEMVFGKMEEFYSEDLTPGERQRLRLREGQHPALAASTLLIRRSSFLRAGEFMTSWRVGEFVDWYLKAAETGITSTVLPKVVARRRLHRSNMGTREKSSRADYARILKESLDRRRQAGTVPAQETDPGDVHEPS